MAVGAGGLGASQRRPDQHYGAPAPGLVPGSRSGNLRARTVIIFGPTGVPVGVFVYAAGTTPGPGNLPILAATSQTQDLYHNSVNPGDSIAGGPLTVIGATPSGGTPSYIQLAAPSAAVLPEILLGTGDSAEIIPGLMLAQITGSGVTRQSQVAISAPGFRVPGTGSAGLTLFSASADGTIAPTISVTGAMTADSWHTLSLVNGWTGTVRYRFLPDGRVELDVVLSSAAATAAQFGTMPAGPPTYRPTANRNVAMGATANVAAGQAPYVSVTAAGVISMNGLAAFSAAGTFTGGGSYPLT